MLKIKSVSVRIAIYAILILFTTFFVYPVFFIIKTSFEPTFSIRSVPPKIIFTPTLRNFIKATTLYEFQRYMTNSIMITASSVALALLLGLPCAYLLARYKLSRKLVNNVSHTILTFRLLPPTAVAVPYFLLYTSIGLFDTHIGLIIIYILSNLPFVVWLMRGFYAEIPKEIEEAAEIDGCSKLGVFLRVTMPLSIYGLAATVLFCTLLTWNEFSIAVIITATKARTLPVQALQFWSVVGMDWGALCAAVMLITLPVLIFGIAIRKYLIRGLTFGAVKG